MPAATSAGSGASGVWAVINDPAITGTAMANVKAATNRFDSRLLTVSLPGKPSAKCIAAYSWKNLCGFRALRG